jgi:thioredoxin family protein
MAIENSLVRADMIEANEFPELSQRYSVYGVPLTVANDQVRLEGGAPEAYFVPHLLQELGIGAQPEPEGNQEPTRNEPD